MSARTVGVEEEFLLFRAGEPRLAEVGAGVIDAAERATDDEAQFEKELKQAQAELGSAPATGLAELAADLTQRRGELVTAAAGRGARVVASGTSPVAGRAETTDDPRYAQMAEHFAAVEQPQLTCAMHVHVAVGSQDEGVAVLAGIAPWLPVLTALSANSPFHDGRDTGYASYRRIVWAQWPTAGPSGAFADPAQYHATIDALVASGAARDDGMIYFDARLSARYPTVEIRVCDVTIDVEDAVTLAGLCRALVTTAAGADPREAAGTRPELRRPELLRAAGWRAARWGMTGELVDLTRAAGPAPLAPAWDLVDALVRELEPALVGTGDLDRIRAGLARIRELGTGAQQQLRAAADGDPAAALERLTLRR